MKKQYTAIAIIMLLMISLVGTALSEEWGWSIKPIDTSNGFGGAFSYPSIDVDVSGSNIYAAYSKFTDPDLNTSIYFAKSTDKGISWAISNIAYGANIAISRNVRTCFSNATLGYIFEHYENEILKTTDGGESWTTVDTITGEIGSNAIDLACKDNDVYAAWYKNTSGNNWALRVRKYSNAGATIVNTTSVETFDTDVGLAYTDSNASIALDVVTDTLGNNYFAVAYVTYSAGTSSLKYFVDGSIFDALSSVGENPTSVDTETGVFRGLSLKTIYSTWYSSGDGRYVVDPAFFVAYETDSDSSNPGLYFSKYTPTAASQVPDGGRIETFSAATGHGTGIGVIPFSSNWGDETIYIAYYDGSDLKFKKSSNGGSVFVIDQKVDYLGNTGYSPSMKYIADGQASIFYYDYSADYFKVATISSFTGIAETVQGVTGFASLTTPSKYARNKDGSVGDNLETGAVAVTPYMYDGDNLDRMRGDKGHGLLTNDVVPLTTFWGMNNAVTTSSGIYNFGGTTGTHFKKIIIHAKSTNTDDICINYWGATATCVKNAVGNDTLPAGTTVEVDGFMMPFFSAIANSGSQRLIIRAWR